MITYPVDTKTARFTFILGETVKRGCQWPNVTGERLVGQDKSLVILEERTGSKPTYDPATQYLAESWVDDTVNQTATLTYTATALSAAAIQKIADSAADTQKRSELAAAISTLNQWSAQAAATTVTVGNVVTVTQTMVTRLGVFFSHFAKLLETQGIK